jgi:hypothetical protein
MGNIQQHPPVKLFSALTYIRNAPLVDIYKDLEHHFSAIELKSKAYNFSAFTDYYEQEMGKGLYKLFLIFAKLVSPEELAAVKLATNAIEAKYMLEKRRTINLDPGYISEAKLVLATTKNYTHRIYLNNGIFGDVHLQYQDQSFRAQPWTYPDYQQSEIIQFFNKVRLKYFHQLGESYYSTIDT